MSDYQGEPADQREYEYLEILWRQQYDPVFNSVGFNELIPTQDQKDSESYNPFENIE